MTWTRKVYCSLNLPMYDPLGKKRRGLNYRQVNFSVNVDRMVFSVHNELSTEVVLKCFNIAHRWNFCEWD